MNWAYKTAIEGVVRQGDESDTPFSSEYDKPALLSSASRGAEVTMNHKNMNPGCGEHVDTVLSRFFQAEMPHPWPECEASAQARRTLVLRRPRAMGRLALAASVALFFFGYFTVASYFPRDNENMPIARDHQSGAMDNGSGLASGTGGPSHQLRQAPKAGQKP